MFGRSEAACLLVAIVRRMGGVLETACLPQSHSDSAIDVLVAETQHEDGASSSGCGGLTGSETWLALPLSCKHAWTRVCSGSSLAIQDGSHRSSALPSSADRCRSDVKYLCVYL